MKRNAFNLCVVGWSVAYSCILCSTNWLSFFPTTVPNQSRTNPTILSNNLISNLPRGQVFHYKVTISSCVLPVFMLFRQSQRAALDSNQRIRNPTYQLIKHSKGRKKIRTLISSSIGINRYYRFQNHLISPLNRSLTKTKNRTTSSVGGLFESGAPTGIRTPVLALKGLRPGPLDDGGLSSVRDFTISPDAGQAVGPAW
jgi:hypothetical protein